MNERLTWPELLSQIETDIRRAGQWRPSDAGLPDPVDGGPIQSGPTENGPNAPVVSFASNDYLGLSRHPAVIEGARRALATYGAGCGSARLVEGTRLEHLLLEAELAAWKSTEAALCFPSGYQANIGVLVALGLAGSVIVSDELNHASIIDGCRLARAEVRVYPHRDLAAVDRLVDSRRPTLVVSDHVFSMDGDRAHVLELARLCQARGAMLVLDQAHLVIEPEFEVRPWPELVVVGTLSKTLGSQGGFVACSQQIADVIRNRARSFMYSTALAPAAVGAARAALSLLRSPAGHRLVDSLRSNVDRLVQGWPTPIVPILTGSADRAVEAAQTLSELGLRVPAIRPPTVPAGRSRLRLSLSSRHSHAEVDRLAAALDVLVPSWKRDLPPSP